MVICARRLIETICSNLILMGPVKSDSPKPPRFDAFADIETGVQDWFRLRGYAEFPIWPMHINSVFCYTAYHAGLNEEILRDPLRIYHIEHRTAAGWSPEGQSLAACQAGHQVLD